MPMLDGQDSGLDQGASQHHEAEMVMPRVRLMGDCKSLSRCVSPLGCYIAFDALIEIYHMAGIGQRGSGKIIGQRLDKVLG